MDSLVASAGQEILKQGLVGVIILVLLWALWTKDKSGLKCMEARLADREATTKALLEATSAMREMAAAQKEAAGAHRDVAETLKREIADAVTLAIARGKR